MAKTTAFQSVDCHDFALLAQAQSLAMTQMGDFHATCENRLQWRIIRIFRTPQKSSLKSHNSPNSQIQVPQKKFGTLFANISLPTKFMGKQKRIKQKKQSKKGQKI